MNMNKKDRGYIKVYPGNLEEAWETFFKRYYTKEIEVLSAQYPHCISVYVQFGDILRFNALLADKLLNEPNETIEVASSVLRDTDTSNGVKLSGANVRITGFLENTKIRKIRSADIGKLVSIEGLVTKATVVYPRILKAKFECPICGHIVTIEQSGRHLREPIECNIKDGGCGKKIQRFKFLADESEFIDMQKIRIQEVPDDLRGGEQPQAITVELAEDLTGKIQPGNKATLAGIVRAEQKRIEGGQSTEFTNYLDGHSVEIEGIENTRLELTPEDVEKIKELSEDPDIYENLIQSLAPSIFGYQEVKEAIMLQLFSGVRKHLPNSSPLRGAIHVLLVGDPGIAKSMLLLQTANLAPHGLYSAGTGSSGVGLTASTRKDTEFGDGKWVLEAGTLVLADMGIAAIDELEKLKIEEQEKLFEAMEQQAVTISKAGIHARLNARCAILAGANPKYGRFDLHESFEEQIKLSTVLLSRFDLIFALLDEPDMERDKKLAAHISHAHSLGERLARNEKISDEFKTFKPKIEQGLLRKYVIYGKAIIPKMSEDARRKLEAFYIDLRSQCKEGEGHKIATRQLEGLIRLSEARARTRLSEEINGNDANDAIRLLSYSLNTVFRDPESGAIDIDRVICGTTNTQRERAKSIREIIKELENEYGEEVPVTKILDLAEEQKIDRGKAEDVINLMKRDGILFSPKEGLVQYVK